MDITDMSPGHLPGHSRSLWRDTTPLPAYPQLAADADTDVAVVGAGLAGLMTAYLLVREGLRVTVLEAGSILNGTTGYTTAKISAQQNSIYDKLMRNLGEEHARAYYQANRHGLEQIRAIAEELGIECELEEQTNYVYATTDSGVKQLEKEWNAYEKLGLRGEQLTELPIPVRIKGAIAMRGEAQFHPLFFLKGLMEQLAGKGAQLYEHTRAVELNTDHEARPQVVTDSGLRVVARHVVVATHFPFCDGIGMYYARLHAERSYVVAAKPATAFPGGMYISKDSPTRSLRSANLRGETVVLVGGENHKTGQQISTLDRYRELERFGEQVLGSRSIPYRWSAQDLSTLDQVPYIGPITDKHPNVYVATGFGKWGMSNGSAAASLIRDCIMERDNPFKELYKPSRFHVKSDVKSFVVQNADVAKSLVTGKLEPVTLTPLALEPGQGAVVEVNGKRCGAFRDEQGDYHVVDTTCTHMGCELEWNDGERSWDCPCHGSRFAPDGQVIEGPALRPLKTVAWPKDQDGLIVSPPSDRDGR